MKSLKSIRIERASVEENTEALKKKSDASGVSLSILKKVYARGVAAWNSGHRPGTTPQQWGMARVNSYITKGKTYHTTDKDLREEDSRIDKKSYHKGLSDKTAKARVAHWKKMDKLSDDNPRAYEPAPGDKTAETKPSKYTKKYHAMFGEQIMNEQTDNEEDYENDFEGQMSRYELEEISVMAQELAEVMDDTDELEAWVQNKITTAYNALDDVYSYADSEGELDSEKETADEEVVKEQTETESPEEKKERKRIEILVRLGLMDKNLLPVIRRAMKKLKQGQNISMRLERETLFDLMQNLIGVVTGDDAIFTKVRMDVTRK